MTDESSDDVRVTFHREDNLWWADSEDIPGWSASGHTLRVLCARVGEALELRADGWFDDAKPVTAAAPAEMIWVTPPGVTLGDGAELTLHYKYA